jgi:tetratricopeptide (TPR) repeat protein
LTIMTDTTTSGDTAALVAEGNAALLAGDSYTARQRFRQVLDRDPRHVAALIGLAGSVRPYREKREYLQRALAIDPENAEARAVLAQVDARLAAGEVLAPGGVQVRESLAADDLAPPPDRPAEGAAPVATLHCYIHPDRETGLRCTNCDRPICADCVRPAAVGQLCPECARARRPVNYQVSAVNLVVAGVAALIYGVVVTFLASQLFGMVGFFGFIIAILLGPVAGDLLVRLTDRLTHNKRGRSMQLALGICYTLGALPWTLLIALVAVFPLSLVVFTIAAVATAVTRVR